MSGPKVCKLDFFVYMTCMHLILCIITNAVLIFSPTKVFHQYYGDEKQHKRKKMGRPQNEKGNRPFMKVAQYLKENAEE